VELWTIIIAIAIGAISSLRMHALVFALIVLGVLCVYAAIRLYMGDAVLQVILWVIIYEFALEGGYVAGLVARHQLGTKAGRKHAEPVAEPGEVSYRAEHRGSSKS